VVAWTSLPVVCAFTTSFALVRSTQAATLGVNGDVADRIEALERWAISEGHAFQANGHHVARAVGDAAGVPLDPAGTRVVPLGGTDRTGRVLRRAGGADDAVDLLFVGRLEPRKGIDLLLAALPEVLERSPRARCTLAGRDDLPDGSGSTFRERFTAAHPDLVGSGRVRFLGEVDDEGLAAALVAADVAVLPSRFESFGLVYVEAMSAGLPVVALRGSGAEEVVDDGATGVLVGEDPAELAAALVGLATDADLRRRLGDAGRTRYEERFTVAAMADRFLDLFRSVTASRPGDDDWPVDPEELVGCSDGRTGRRLRPGAAVEVVPGPGRTTVVVTAVGERAATVEVRPDLGAPTSRRVHPGEYGHVVLPAGCRTATVTRLDGGPAAVAAVVRVRGDGVGNDVLHGG
jgi:hypothetical protein